MADSRYPSFNDKEFDLLKKIAYNSALISDNLSISSLLDMISSTRGSVLYRGASGWAALTPGTAGQFLQTGGAGANPSWGTGTGVLPSQTGNSGKLLTTDGTNASWTATPNIGAATGTSLSLSGGEISQSSTVAGAYGFSLRNASSSASAYSKLTIGNDTGASGGIIYNFSSAWSGAAAYPANGVVIESAQAGGLNLITTNGSGGVKIYTAGTAAGNLTATFDTSRNTTLAGNLTVSGTTASTSTTTGAFTVAGGAGFGGALYAGDSSTVRKDQAATTSFTIANASSNASAATRLVLTANAGGGEGNAGTITLNNSTNNLEITAAATTGASNRSIVLTSAGTGTITAAGNLTVSGASGITASSLTGPTTTDLTLQGGSSGASLVLGQGASGAITATLPGSGLATVVGTIVATDASGAGAGVLRVRNNTTTVTTAPSFVLGINRQNSAVGALYLGADANNDAIISTGNGNLRVGREQSGTFTEIARFTNTTQNLLIGTTTDMSGSGGVKVAGTTASTSTTTGSLINAGGFGNAGAAYIGGFLSTAGNVSLASGSNLVALSGASNSVSGGLPVAWNGNFGIGFQYAGSAVNNIYIGDGTGGRVNFVSRTASTNTTLGTLTDTGSLTLAGNLTVSGTGTSSFAGPVSLNGAGNPIKGTTTNDNAATGYVGEYVSSTIVSGSAVSLTTDTAANVTSISLSAGDWDVMGTLKSDISTGATYFQGTFNTTTATISTGDDAFTGISAAITATQYTSLAMPVVRLSLSGTTTVYFVAKAGFSSGTVKAWGQIRARRVR